MSSLSSSGGIPGIDSQPTVRRVSQGDPDKRREQQDKRQKQKPSHEDQVELHEEAGGEAPADSTGATEASSSTPPPDEHPHIDVRG